MSLLGFWALLTLAPEAAGEVSGRVFYVWFSVFNLFSTMVFWALMVDRFSVEQSKRLFGMIAVGGTLGAICGPWLAVLLAAPLGTANLLLVAVACIVCAIGCAWLVARLQTGRLDSAARADPRRVADPATGNGDWRPCMGRREGNRPLAVPPRYFRIRIDSRGGGHVPVLHALGDGGSIGRRLGSAPQRGLRASTSLPKAPLWVCSWWLPDTS